MDQTNYTRFFRKIFPVIDCWFLVVTEFHRFDPTYTAIVLGNIFDNTIQHRHSN